MSGSLAHRPDAGPAERALADLGGRSGAQTWELALVTADGEHMGHEAAMTYGAQQITARGADTEEACDLLAAKILAGGQCRGCGNITSTPLDRRVGSIADLEDVKKHGPCAWSRQDGRWMRGCGEDPPADSTRAKLASALCEGRVPSGMLAYARAGGFDDFLSSSATPQLDLLTAAAGIGRDDIAQRARNGEFCASRAESDAWARSPEGREVLRDVGLEPPGSS